MQHTMVASAETHFARLARAETLRALADMGFDWTAGHQNVCATLRFKHEYPAAPVIVGLVGGASSGKSTLFNTLVGAHASRISALAHETCAPLAAVFSEGLDQIEAWIEQHKLFVDFKPVTRAGDEPSAGRLGTVTLIPHHCAQISEKVLVDTPDVTSKMSADEGSLTSRLQPWFDALIIVLDEERWFDATVFENHATAARDLGQPFLLLFNQTADNAELLPEEARQVAQHARDRHAAAHCLSPFQPGAGYRPLSETTREQILPWLSGIDAAGRVSKLQDYLRRVSTSLVQVNVRRSEQFKDLCRAVDKEMRTLEQETHLTTDLLTGAEQQALGLGRRYLPFYDALRSLRHRLARLTRPLQAWSDVDFEKDPQALGTVLRRNLELRYRHATECIDQLILDSTYHRESGARWQPGWELPAFDEHIWAKRIRAHIDAWKTERNKQTRRGDVLAAVLGAPLLLADLLFLGGAGLTLTWTAASVAGFFGGKGVLGLAQRSEAFKAYQTTVSAYQSLIRESLTDQWARNLEALPRRHFKVSDPILQALMFWSTPHQREGESRW